MSVTLHINNGHKIDMEELLEALPASKAKKEWDALQLSKDQAYHERNMLVAFLCNLYPAHMKRHPKEDAEWENDWRNIVCVHSPMGQLTWHIHDSEAEMFSFLNQTPEPFPDCEWDGHTTSEKYGRLLSVNTGKGKN